MKFEKEKMTWVDLVRKHLHNASDEEVEFILWEKTAFPLATVETVERQIIEFKKEIVKE